MARPNTSIKPTGGGAVRSTSVTTPDWVVRRDGSADEVLTTSGEWGTMDDAAWFASQAEALEASYPAGTSGTPIQVHPDTAT